MRTWKTVGAVLIAATAMAATPASAQDRSRRAADEIAREIRNAADAISTVRDAVDDSVSDIRFRGRDREAVDRCGPYVERYGRMHVDDVRRYGRRSLRVYGTVDDNRYGYGSRGRYALRGFTCTVRDDGRVKLKTSRVRR